MPDQDQKPGENPDYSWPGAGPDPGAGAEVASLAAPSLEEAIPLLGTIVGLGSAAVHGWDSHFYQGMADDHRQQGWDPKDVKSLQDTSDHYAEEAKGDLINAIPLVGLARALM
jgi:hypothetical protein